MLYSIGNTKISNTEWCNVKYDIEYSKEDLRKLEPSLIQLPKVLNNDKLKLARISLANTEN